MKAQRGGWEPRNGGYFSLCSTILRDIHQDYHKLLEYLVQAGIFETDGLYIQGEKCTGYRFTERYTGVPFKEVTLKNLTLIGNIRKQREKIAQHHRDQTKQYSHIVKWYLTHKLSIDREAAMRWVELYYVDSWLAIVQNAPDRATADKDRKSLMDVCTSMKLFIDKLHNSQYDITDFSVDKFGNRLHGLFTSIKKELRNFITYDGQPLVAVDVKNSQPYFSTCMLYAEFWKSQKKRARHMQWWKVPGIGRREVEGICRCGSIMLLDSSETLAHRRLSIGKFRNLAASGELYEVLQKSFQECLSPEFKASQGHRIAHRANVKRELLRIMYSENSRAHLPFYEPSRAFRRQFPEVYHLFRAVKHQDYKLLPRIIQRMESHVILDLACKRIAKERPDLPIFTIHDSIITLVGEEDYVQQVLMEVLTEQVGIPPKLKLEYWLPENAYPIKVWDKYGPDELEEIDILPFWQCH